MSLVERILLVNYEYPPIGGGAGNAAAMIAPRLAARARVLVVTSAFDGLPRREERDGYAIHRVPALRRRSDRCNPVQMCAFMASATLHCLREARRFKPDATLAFFSIPGGPVALALRLSLGVPYAVAFRGGDVPGFRQRGLGLYHRLVTPLFSMVCNKSGALTANSTGLAALAERSLPGREVVVIPNGVDCHHYTPPAEPREGAPLFLYAGRLSHQKGVDVLLSALAHPAAAGAGRARLRIVGDGPERPRLERQTAALGLRHRVDFAGWADKNAMPEEYRRADAFVLPSRDEGMPNVVLEAMATGLPVVGTAVSGNAELIRDRATGLLVPAEDPAALGAALAEMAQAPALRREMGERGRKDVLAEYSWNTCATRIHRLLEQAVQSDAA